MSEGTALSTAEISVSITRNNHSLTLEQCLQTERAEQEVSQGSLTWFLICMLPEILFVFI